MDFSNNCVLSVSVLSIVSAFGSDFDKKQGTVGRETRNTDQTRCLHLLNERRQGTEKQEKVEPKKGKI